MPARHLRPRTSIAIITLSAAFAALAVTGCSSSTSPDGLTATKKPADSTVTKTAKTGCAAIDKGALTAAFGSGYSAPQQTVVDSVTVCTFAGSSGAVTIRIDTDSDSARFDGIKAGFAASKQTTTDVSGVGDKAYTSSLKAGKFVVTTLDALHGSVEILVSSGATLDQEKQFETQLFTTLG